MNGGLPGFGDLLAEADAANKKRRLDRATAHLPNAWDEGVALHRQQIADYHASLLRGDLKAARVVHVDAERLAVKLGGGDTGFLAGPDAAGCRLATTCAAPDGTVPLWGQSGKFVVTVAGCSVNIEQDGVFGICGGHGYPGFAARAVDRDKPFLSETGYRSFLGAYHPVTAGLTPDALAAAIIEEYVAKEMKGKLVRIGPPEVKKPRTRRKP